MERNSIPHNCFSFLKLLKDENYSKEIRIPHTFVTNHPGKFSRRCVLLDAQTNISWTVKIRCRGRETNCYYICEGEWPDFVKFYDLKHGDYLLFFLIDQAIFRVIPYGADCCQKIRNCNEFDLSSSGSSDDDDDYSSSEHSEEDDEVNKKHRVDSRFSRWLQRNQPHKKHKVESGAGPSNRSQNFKKPTFELSLPGPSNRSQNLITSRKSARGISDTSIDLNPKDPFCIVTIKKHNNRYMTVPRPFARETKIEEKKNVILHGEDKREWEVGIQHGSGRVDMVKGWPDFYKGYGLKEDDTCKFTHLKVSENELLVEITRKMHP